MITVDRLLALAPGANRLFVNNIAEPLDENSGSYGITTPLRCAHFIAQICYESDMFTRLVENLSYSAGRIGEVWPRLGPRAASLTHNPQALGNAAYGDRLGNGDEASGDGYRYRGRGLIQITGRDNYERFGDIAGLDLVGNPDLASDMTNASVIALAYWQHAGCNALADTDDVDAVTKAINGPAMAGLDARRNLTARAKGIFV